jgi:GTP-binding protein TrmE N-terminus
MLSGSKTLSLPIAHLAAALRTRPLTTLSSCPQSHTLPLSDAQRKTIYALSTPPGKSGVAVIRVSGPDALGVWHRMVRSPRAAPVSQWQQVKGKQSRSAPISPPEPWKLERCHVVDPHTSQLLDDALAVYFRGKSGPNAHLHTLPSFFLPPADDGVRLTISLTIYILQQKSMTSTYSPALFHH